MSASRFSEADSGRNHLVPLLVALALAAIVIGLSWVWAGPMPH